MKNDLKSRGSERGSAGVKLVVVVVAIFLLANAGYNYVPVAYNAESLKTEMQTSVLQGLALPGRMNPVDNVKARIQTAMQRNDIPADAIVEVKQTGNSMTAHVAYQQQVNMLPFGLYRYTYKFDYTATPTGFLLKQ
ncbi:MAG: hypothetical protein JO053_00765 [Acidobacteria bacterium]|nr:hypothetical protein [Acidobacteriota bacterium]